MDINEQNQKDIDAILDLFKYGSDDIWKPGTPLAETFKRVMEERQKLIGTLADIILSCSHPEIAVRTIMVDLKPIRKVLKECGIKDKKLGIN